MQTYFSTALENLKQALEATASHHLAQQARLVDDARKALASVTAASKKLKGDAQSEAVKAATQQLAEFEARQKAMDQLFAQYRAQLAKTS